MHVFCYNISFPNYLEFLKQILVEIQQWETIWQKTSHLETMPRLNLRDLFEFNIPAGG